MLSGRQRALLQGRRLYAPHGISGRTRRASTAQRNTIPDSTVANAIATDYDGSKWVANIGPDVTDAGGNPTKQNKTYRSNSIDVVKYKKSNSDYSQINQSVGTKYCLVITLASRSTGITDWLFDGDGGGGISFGVHHSSGSYRIRADGIDETGGTADNNLHTFALEYSGTGTDEFRFFKDSTSALISGTPSSVPSHSNIFLNQRGDENADSEGDNDIREFTLLENHSTSDRDKEINRQMEKHNIP